MKGRRHSIIVDIINNDDVSSHDQILKALLNVGITASQPTISRDMKELCIIKAKSQNGTILYTVSKSTPIIEQYGNLAKILIESIQSFECAQSIVVIKTTPGLAPAVCSVIEGRNIMGLAGAIAGDDTIFVAMNDSYAAEQFYLELQKKFKIMTKKNSKIMSDNN